MGYEIKLIIGRKGFAGHENKDCTGIIEIASIDLCKCVFAGTRVNKQQIHKAFIYKGDDEVLTDLYGDQLYHNSPKEVLKLMVKAQKYEKYRRYSAAIPMLKSLIRDFEGQDLTCILYGH